MAGILSINSITKKSWLFTSSDSEPHTIFSRWNQNHRCCFGSILESWKWFLLGCWFLRGTMMFTAFHLRWRVSDAAKDCARRTVKTHLWLCEHASHKTHRSNGTRNQTLTPLFMLLWSCSAKTLGNAHSLNIIAALGPLRWQARPALKCGHLPQIETLWGCVPVRASNVPR